MKAVQTWKTWKTWKPWKTWKWVSVGTRLAWKQDMAVEMPYGRGNCVCIHSCRECMREDHVYKKSIRMVTQDSRQPQIRKDRNTSEKHARGAFGEAVLTGSHSERSPMEGRHRQVPHRSTTIFCNNFLGALPLTATRGRRISEEVSPQHWRPMVKDLFWVLADTRGPVQFQGKRVVFSWYLGPGTPSGLTL